MIDTLFKKWRRHQLFVEPNSGLTQIKDEIEFELHGLWTIIRILCLLLLGQNFIGTKTTDNFFS